MSKMNRAEVTLMMLKRKMMFYFDKIHNLFKLNYKNFLQILLIRFFFLLIFIFFLFTKIHDNLIL